MDNLGAIIGPLLGIGLVALVGVRTAIVMSIIPGLAVGAIVCAIHAAACRQSGRQPVRIRVRPVLRGHLGRLLLAVSAFEVGNIAATLLILRATELLTPDHGDDSAVQLALGPRYTAYNIAATAISLWEIALGSRSHHRGCFGSPCGRRRGPRRRRAPAGSSAPPS
jgi:hypothetical protein